MKKPRYFAIKVDGHGLLDSLIDTDEGCRCQPKIFYKKADADKELERLNKIFKDNIKDLRVAEIIIKESETINGI